MVIVWFIALSLMAAGVFLLIRGIEQIQRSVGGPVLLKLPMTQKSGLFVVSHTGDYAIWQSGSRLQRVPVKMPVPVITDQHTGQTIRVEPIFSRVRVNSGSEGRIQLFTFWAKVGNYELEWPTVDTTFHTESPYFLDIRERKPGYLLVLGILIVLLAATCLIGGWYCRSLPTMPAGFESISRTLIVPDMKPGLTNLIFFLLLVPMSCQNTVSPTNDLDQAREWFNGKWNMTAVSSMILNPTVPNVQLIVDNNQIVVIQDGKQTGLVDFEIMKTAYNLQLITNAQPRAANWYVRNPALQIARNRLFLDAGVAVDGPGFTFERIK
ncbi:hypothetical protein [Spirosoma koreense]